ncbi:MAG: hypothetical protein Q4D06_01305 [Coriobacteriia bacterium]|nr:hypothetical protein [Coriobacteriia bacterium]
MGALLAVLAMVALVSLSGAAAWVLRGDGVALQVARDLTDPEGDPVREVVDIMAGEDQVVAGGGAAGSADQVAPLLVEEGFVPAKACDVRIGGQGRVVGFSLPGSAADAFARMATGLEEAGWTTVPSGQDVCGTFVKEDGRLRWLLVSCSDAGGSASVVIQSAVDLGKEE